VIARAVVRAVLIWPSAGILISNQGYGCNPSMGLLTVARPWHGRRYFTWVRPAAGPIQLVIGRRECIATSRDNGDRIPRGS